MDLLNLAGALGPIDLTALAFIFACWLGIGWWIEHPSARRPSVTMLMKGYRKAWMRAFITREPRIFDAQILATLRQGTAFFGSTNLLAIGGTFALIGNASQLDEITNALPNATSAGTLRLKLLLVIFFLGSGFLKFVWSNRLFGYCAVIMAAVPNDPSDPRTDPWADKAGDINIRAAMNFNRGLRATYFALAALAWLAGSWMLIAASILTCILLWQREFASLSQTILSEDGPKGK